MFDNSIKIRTLKNLFGSFGWVSLASPFTYLAATPNLIARFLSGEQQRWDMKLHYSASLVSILSYGTILGTVVILKIFRFASAKIRPIVLTSVIACIIFITTYKASLQDTDLPIHQFILQKNTLLDPNAPEMRARLTVLMQDIGDNASVSTISSFVPFFATREHITKFTGSADASADWIILSNKFVSWPLSISEINREIHEMRQNTRYTPIINSDGLFVFKKNV